VHAVAELNQNETAALKTAMKIYPHIARRAFYAACFMEGVRTLTQAAENGDPIPLHKLFDVEGKTIITHTKPTNRNRKKINE